MAKLLYLIAHACFATFIFASNTASATRTTYCPIFYPESDPPRNCEPTQPTTFLKSPLAYQPPTDATALDLESLEKAFEALNVMQREFFRAEQGTWPTAIDWTAAVMETVLSGLLTSLSQALGVIDFDNRTDWRAKENLVDSFFSQIVGSYFGQDDVSIRLQAYDDILWVVLGWTEAISFVNIHSEVHYPGYTMDDVMGLDIGGALRKQPWHGYVWIPSFAHRARLFWDLASHGWDNRLCNGGMTWNPRLEPYKNAITNELWIAASISMYLYFPGDNNTNPWVRPENSLATTRDPKYLAAAVEGYKWLTDVNMTNSQGLFVDGYHVDKSKRGNTKCDVRSEAVYTYNQGVILTGQRGLWTATGQASYLEDGHGLIQSVIEASGWDLQNDRPFDKLSELRPGTLPPWRGLGRGGIMEENCDASATCSQDGHTFKGIFFHHFVAFCSPTEPVDLERGMTLDARSYQQIKTAHDAACQAYSGWVTYNAKAALMTRDSKGRFGTWWGAGVFGGTTVTMETDGIPHDMPNATDYRNYGIPHDGIWSDGNPDRIWAPNGGAHGPATKDSAQRYRGQQVLGRANKRQEATASGDPNSRGRGRTPETQNGGMALMRAWWELVVAAPNNSNDAKQ